MRVPTRRAIPRPRSSRLSGARDLVSEAVRVDQVTDQLDDRDISLAVVAGTDEREFAMQVRRPGGISLIVNDIIAHVANPQGFGAWVMARLFGFGAKRPAVPRPVQAKLVSDPGPLAAQFEQWAAITGLRRIIPSHGEIIDSQPSAELAPAGASAQRLTLII